MDEGVSIEGIGLGGSPPRLRLAIDVTSGDAGAAILALAC